MERVLLVSAMKAGFLLAAALVATRLFARASAATRHLVLCAALAGALLLPGLAAIVPDWRVELPARAAPPSVESTTRETAVPAPPPLRPIVEVAPARRSAPRTAGTVSPAFPWVPAAWALWASVALALLVRELAGWLRLARIAREADRVLHPGWLLLLGDLAGELGITRRVELLSSPTATVPMTWGTLRPCIVLPSGAEAWPQERRRAVLLHELAHVERFDALTQLVARLACAVHWPNPFAWMAASTMRRERERACDDRVLSAGARPSDYATSLLEIARDAVRNGGLAAALAMARKSQLEGRLLAVLDPGAPRVALTRRSVWAATATAAAMVVPLAALEAQEARPRAVAQAAAKPTFALPGLAAAAQPRPVIASAAFPAREAARAPAMPAVPAVPPAPAAPAAAAAPIARRAALGPAPSRLADPPEPPDAPEPPVEPDSHSRHTSFHSETDDSGDWKISWSMDDGSTGKARGIGKVESTADLRDLVLGPGALFDATIREGGKVKRVTLSADREGRVRRSYSVDGAEQPWDAAGFASFLEKLDRHSGILAERRFPALLRDRGPNGVLREIERMDGDHVRGLYLRNLLQSARLDRRQLTEALRLSHQLSSDYELANVLVLAVSRTDLSSGSERAAFLEAAGQLRSDYELGRVLRGFLDKGSPSAAELRLLLSAADRLSSDYERGRLLMTLAGHKLPAELRGAYLDAATGLRSDYEHGQALRALAADGSLDDATLRRLIEQAAGLHSDYEGASVLVSIAQRQSLDPAARRALQQAAESLRSQYERERVLASLRSR